MNLDLTPAELAFQKGVRAFLEANLSDELRAAVARSTASFCGLYETLTWHRTLHAQGWVAPDWPAEFGGPGWTAMQRHIFQAECARAGSPAPLTFGLKMCGPILMRYGSIEQRAFYLPKILSGEHRWCQGYSEPGAGSDLAALRTSAVRDGDDYVVSGQKLWTTFGHLATHMFCLVRTDASGRRQDGITFLLVDMASPGISVRPIVNIAGDHEFNEVRFDNVRVAVRDRVGPEGEGWAVAKALLEFERGLGYAAGLRARLGWVRRLMNEAGLDTPAARQRLIELEVSVSAVEMQEHRALSALKLAEPPGSAASMIKLQGSELIQRLDELAVEALAPSGAAPDTAGATVMGRYLYDRSVTIFGGTSEIQRNILARAALGV